MSQPLKSILDVVKECDNFPYHDEGEVFAKTMEGLWAFYIPDDPEPHGYMVDSIVEKMPWTSHFRVVSSPRKEIHLLKADGENWQAGCEKALDDVIEDARAQGIFPRLVKKKNELFPVVGSRYSLSMDRSSIPMWGVIAQGSHMTVYTRTPEGLKFWIPRRNATKATYPNLLDQAVAGGIATGETPFECIIREAEEEAALDPAFTRARAVRTGSVSWFHIGDEKAGGEVGLMNPGVLYVYDLEVGSDVVFKPVDDDIQNFQLMDADQVKDAMRRGEFKMSCAVVMVDFFIRHGLITPEDEPDYVEIMSRLHRRLPFRTNPTA